MKNLVIILALGLVMVSCNKNNDVTNAEIKLKVLGSGEVQLNPDQENYNIGTEVDLQAMPSAEWSFLEWEGDLSGTDNSTQISISSSNEVIAKFEPQYGEITDIEGNKYKTFQIGSQVWMTQNLNTSLFNNGDTIMQAVDVNNWMNAFQNGKPAWTYYNGNEDYGTPYGKLYNKHAIMEFTICPDGWHVPTDDEWQNLEMFLGMKEDDVKTGGYRDPMVTDKMISYRTKTEDHPRWESNNFSSNESGFSADPGGYRIGTPLTNTQQEGQFKELGSEASYWSSTNFGRGLRKGRGVYRAEVPEAFGFSCRCIKD